MRGVLIFKAQLCCNAIYCCVQCSIAIDAWLSCLFPVTLARHQWLADKNRAETICKWGATPLLCGQVSEFAPLNEILESRIDASCAARAALAAYLCNLLF